MSNRKVEKLPSLNLSLDLGNTRVKAGLFKGKEFDRKIEFNLEAGIESFYAWLEGLHVHNVICSNVHTEIDPPSVLRFKHDFWVSLDENTKLPFNNLYKTPSTLGKDRIAAVAGANSLYPEQDVLVFDAGTCLTSDFISKSGDYIGGSISPGLFMRFKAMHSLTARLPLLDPQLEVELTGTDTKSSMLTGGVVGMALEIDGFIDRYKAIYPDLKVVFTGGDHIFFDKNLKNDIFVAPNLVLQGLNEILYYNHVF